MAKKTVKKSKNNDLVTEKEKLEIFKQESLRRGPNQFVEILREHLPKQIIFIAIVVILVIFFMMNLNVIGEFIHKVINILLPIIIGFIMTYLMAPLYDLVVNLIDKHNKKLNKFAKSIGTVACLVATLAIIIGLLFLFIPQLYASIRNFTYKANGYLENIENWIENARNTTQNESFKLALAKIQEKMNEVFAHGDDIFKLDIPNIVTKISNGFYLSLKTILNIFVGIVVMMYTLNMKTELANGLKRMIFAFCRKDIAQKLLVEVRFANKVFSGFLVGKILDSLIIGVLCYICCLIMRMPYTPLIAVIVGVTNIIPFFGPFIGAVPSFIIIWLETPFSWRPYGFLLFILALQQLDGNVIGPKILGDKTGVGSFWVLFSILLFGGLFGFVGMIIAVPMWAIIQRLIEEIVVNKLKEKKYPLTIDEYQKLKRYHATLNEVAPVTKKMI